MRMYGRAVIGNIAGAVTHAAITTGGKALLTGVEATHNWEEASKFYDPATGKIVGILLKDETYDIVIDFIPSADTAVGNTKANAAKSLPFPSPYVLATLSGFENAQFNDTFLYVGGGSQVYSPTGEAKWRLPLRRYNELDDTAHTSLATEVTS